MTPTTNTRMPAPLLLPALLALGVWFIAPDGLLRTALLLAAVVLSLVMLQQWLAHQRWFGVFWKRIPSIRWRSVVVTSDAMRAAQAAAFVVGIVACIGGGIAFAALAQQHPITRYTYDTAHLDNAPNLAEYRGFYSAERDVAYGTYTWTQNRATLVFDFLVHRPITLTVEMRSAARAGGPDAPVEVYADGVKVGELRPDPANPAFTTQQLRFVPPDWGGTQTEIKLIPASFQPKGGDSRTLGTMVQHITVDRGEAWSSIARWRWLLWIVPVMAALIGALWLVRWRRGREARGCVWLDVGIVVCGLAGSATAAAFLIVLIRVGAIASDTYRANLIRAAYLALLFLSLALLPVILRFPRLARVPTGIRTDSVVTVSTPRVENTRRVIGRDLALVFVIALAIRVIWALLVPPWLSPDEPEHYLYVAHIAEQGRLPLRPYPNAPDYPEEYFQSVTLFLTQKLSPGFSAEDRGVPYYPVARDYRPTQTFASPSADRLTKLGGPRATQYPPLYYLLEAIPYRLVKDTPILTRIFAVRGGTAVLGALSCVFGYLLAYEVRRQRRWGYALGLSMALMPMYVFNTTTISNDAMLDLTTVALLWLLVRAWMHGLTRTLALAIGIASGCVLLSKPTATLLVVAGAVVVLAKAWAARDTARPSATTAPTPLASSTPFTPLARLIALPRQGATVGLYALGVVALYGPWLAVRWFVTGNSGLSIGAIVLPFFRWLTGASRVAVVPGSSPPAAAATHSIGEYLRFRLNQGGEHYDWLFVRTFWGYFGWLDLPMGASVYAIIHVFLVIGLIGLALLVVLRREDRGITLLLITLVIVQVVFLFGGADYLFSYRTGGTELGLQGRYFFPVLAPFLLLCLMGWDWLGRGHPLVTRLAPWFMLAIQLAGLGTILTSYYGVTFG